MGSEHYCLRWNNHQSNLLGVFSQLLQDESLVDVTLACSEGAPIRAHKVVLSACSSYFQSLFLDHPERHPIVILKDVRFTELQTLVEFMYKGEVNVQYCQLSALLKTAESLKVKGLAEMTNQNTALREPEREPDRLRPHSQPKPSTCDSPLDGSASAHSAANSTSSLHHNSSLSLKREACSAAERCSPSPPKRLQQSSPVPLDLYQRRCPSSGGGVGGDMSATSTSVGGGGNGGGGAARASSNISNNNNSNISSNSNNNNNDDPPHHHLLQHHHHHHHHQQHQQQQQQHHLATSPRDEHDRDRPSSANDDTSSNDQHSIGINMSLNANSAAAAAAAASNSSQQSSTSQSVVVPPVNSSSTSTAPSASAAAASSSTSAAIPSDLTNRPASRSGGGVDRPSSSGNIPPLPSSALTHTATSSSSGLASPILSGGSGGVASAGEPVAGPSGLGPVQSVPLSLKKEIDWDRDEKTSSGGGGGGDLDYRTSHDSETSESPHGGGGGGCGSGGGGGGSVPSLEGAPAPLYPCMYCGATFPHQSKLTRHILSHSLETLKYREATVPHLLHPGHMMPHELPPLSQHFPRQVLPSLEGCLDPQDSSPTTIEMEFAAAAAAAMSSVGGNSSLSIAGGGCSSGNGGIGGSGGGIGGSSSGLAMGSGGACSSSSSTSNDPNSVVLCKFCGKSFPDVASLITHLPVHTGDRPFKCEFCGKAFKLRHHMKDHCRVHTGERPFRCHMCGKTFSRSTILKAHEKTHFPKYVRKFLSPSPVDTKDELPQ